MNFIHAAFLATALAIGIPWLLHLTKKRKYLRIRLGSLQFLQPLVRNRHRMSRIEQWPLLIARCLAILLLALIFSRPFFKKPAPEPPVQGEVLILLDGSGSITPAQADEIRKQAAETIRQLPTTAKPLIVQVTGRMDELASLEDYHPIPGAAGSPSSAVDWIVDRAASAPNVIGGVHWFTDLQKSALPSSPGRLWPSGLQVEVHASSPPGNRNASISQIDLLTPFGGNFWEVEARVQVSGMPGDVPIALTLTTGDGQTLETTVSSAGGSAAFRWKGEAIDGKLSGEVAINDSKDPWPADDRRPFSFTTTQPIKVLLVDGDPTSSRFTSETYFLQKALHASAAGKSLSPFRAVVSPSLPAPGQDLDVIAICNPPGLSTSNTRLLANYAENGTGLVLFMGNLANPTGWTAPADGGIFPPNLNVATTPATSYPRRFDDRHPALAGMTPDSFRGLRLIPLERRFTWPKNDGWSSIIDFADGSPLLAVSTTKRLAVFTHQVNREGADLPLDPGFVPLMQNLFSYLASSDSQTGDSGQIAARSPGFDDPRAPGLYPDGANSVLITADNLESDITATSLEAFREQLGLPESNEPMTEISETADAAESPHERSGEIWPWLLAVLFLLLAVESVLSARRAQNPASSPAHAN